MVIIFILLSLILTAVCLFFVLRPLFRRHLLDTLHKPDDLVAVYRDKLDKLKLQLDNDELDNEQYRLAKQELEVALASELPVNKQEMKHSFSNLGTGWVMGIGLPLTAVILYLSFGNPQAMSPESLHVEGDRTSLATMTSSLEQKLADNPDDLQGWLLLGRSYASMGQAEKSNQVFARAVQLAPDNPDILLDYAESVARLQGDSLVGKPEQSIDQALLLAPDSLRGRMLKGVALFQAGRAEDAQAVWHPLYLDNTLSQQEHELVGQLIEAAGGQLPTSKPSVPASITISVALDKSLQNLSNPQDTLLIYARSTSGPPIPLAIERHKAGELPLALTLDDSDAMLPQRKLSDASQVIVNARVSKSGSATPTSGDLLGSSPALNPATQPSINITIDQVLP